MFLQELSRSRLLDGFREIERIQSQLNHLFDGYSAWRTTHEYPAINVWASQDSVVVTAELPGVAPEDIDVSVVNDTLTIRGSRQTELSSNSAPAQEAVYRSERPFGQFSRSIQLPFRIDSDKIAAAFKKGVLQLTLPRAEQDKPKKIAVCGE
jgi:HSP20 family protein